MVDRKEESVKKGENLTLCLVRVSSGENVLPRESYTRLYAAVMIKEENGKSVQKYEEHENKYSIVKDKVV